MADAIGGLGVGPETGEFLYWALRALVLWILWTVFTSRLPAMPREQS